MELIGLSITVPDIVLYFSMVPLSRRSILRVWPEEQCSTPTAGLPKRPDIERLRRGQDDDARPSGSEGLNTPWRRGGISD
jgi:hypothetical protein